MSDEISEIRARVDIVDLIGQSVALKRKGKTFVGLCPFHEDHNPSFNVSPDLGRYTCWSCKESGDIFSWVMKTQNVTFPEALETLAEKAGVALRRQKPADRSIRANQRAAMEAALSFFQDQLGKSSDARQYCEKRGLNEHVREHWELGYAPDVGEALTVYLQRKGFRLADCKPLFLVDGDENGYRDKFRARLMFPIRDEKGELVGFGGRVIGDGIPKYINSSDTPLYRKSKVLYGMHHARNSIRDAGEAVLVEGYLDVIACHEAGVTTAIASLGTSLAIDQAKLLKRWCERITILYDSDQAGQKAADRAAQIFREEGLFVRIAPVPQGKDPDTLLRSVGPEAVRQAVSGGLSPLEFKIRMLQSELGVTSEEFWQQAIESVRAESNPLEQARLIDFLAPKYPKVRDVGAAKRALREMIQANPQAARRPRTQGRDLEYLEKNLARYLHPLEVSLFGAVLHEEFRHEAWPFVSNGEMLLTENGKKLGNRLKETFPAGPPVGPARAWVEQIESKGAKELLEAVARDTRVQVSREFFDDTIRGLRAKADEREVEDLKNQEGDDRLVQIQHKLAKQSTRTP